MKRIEHGATVRYFLSSPLNLYVTAVAYTLLSMGAMIWLCFNLAVYANTGRIISQPCSLSIDSLGFTDENHTLQKGQCFLEVTAICSGLRVEGLWILDYGPVSVVADYIMHHSCWLGRVGA